jgi:aminopeptidase
MKDFAKKLDQYAEVAVRAGLNIQPGQTLWINAPIHAPELVRLITRKAYEAGAKNVHVEWYDDVITRLKYDMAPDETFEQYPSWRVQAMEELAATDGAYLWIASSDPELLKGVPTSRISAASRANGKALAKWREMMTADKFTWSIIGAPSPEWAARVFPDLEQKQATEALWEAILNAARITGEDPVQGWRRHDAELQRRRELLNRKKYRKLHYRAPGTELTVTLPDGHIWCGGSSENERGTVFFANMPTEEVFTSPLKEGTSGYVTSTMPLSYQGNLIENFTLTFENGRITDFKAEKGYDALKSLLEVDEGARYLGEVALVPHQSPISQSGIVYYNTLYDENASCHLAIGNAYAFCLENGKTMDMEERKAAGLNTSITHVDFMIGSGQLDIDGEKADGTLEPIFRSGSWAF